MNIQELKTKSSEHLIAQAEEIGIENASTLKNMNFKNIAHKIMAQIYQNILTNLQIGFQKLHHHCKRFPVSWEWTTSGH